MATWETKELIVEGQSVLAQTPLIISASRSTDIPAFYADWFFRRLEEGYSVWKNPFNGIKYYISYENTHFIVFWSKNPRPLLQHLHKLKERDIKCYIQYTLNDYELEGLEKVPSLDYRIETFKLLVERLGKETVVWRFDPMILTDDITIDKLLQKVQNIGDQLKGYTEKLVFSYADIAPYAKVRNNLKASGITYHEWTVEQMEEFAYKLASLNFERGWNYELATCGEKIDLFKYGIIHNRCIDGDLITKLAWNDKVLMDFMGVKIESAEQNLFLPEDAIKLPDGHFFVSKHKKDKGQRLFCECMASKDIGEYNTCPHLCEYCYANASKTAALTNYRKYKENPYNDSIV